jgi:hypothetical protein
MQLDAMARAIASTQIAVQLDRSPENRWPYQTTDGPRESMMHHTTNLAEEAPSPSVVPFLTIWIG